jgi:hypothetical protein
LEHFLEPLHERIRKGHVELPFRKGCSGGYNRAKIGRMGSERLSAVVSAVLVCGVASIPILVVTGVAPHWFWILF